MNFLRYDIDRFLDYLDEWLYMFFSYHQRRLILDSCHSLIDKIMFSNI